MVHLSSISLIIIIVGVNTMLEIIIKVTNSSSVLVIVAIPAKMTSSEAGLAVGESGV